MRETCVMLDAVCLAAQIILESGGETYRAEETAERMSRGFGILKMDAFALPTGVTMTIQTQDGESLTRIVRVQSRGINLARIDQCNCVSRKVAQGTMTAAEALAQLEKIRATPPTRQYLMVIACAFSSAFFTIMLGGEWPDFLVSLLCGTFTQLLLPILTARRVPAVLSGMMAGFLTTFITLLSKMYFPFLHVEPIISGAIMPLLPGLAMTNAIRDTMRGDLVSGGARTVEAVLCALMLGAGVGIMMSVWGGIIG